GGYCFLPLFRRSPAERERDFDPEGVRRAEGFFGAREATSSMTFTSGASSQVASVLACSTDSNSGLPSLLRASRYTSTNVWSSGADVAIATSSADDSRLM